MLLLTACWTGQPAIPMGVKNKGMLFLGLDTSAYTTAAALVDQSEHLVWEKRELLSVPEGGLGLRQSEAVFAHLQNLPRLWAEGAAALKSAPLAAVAASTRPRPAEGSYMPVFKVSEAFGKFIAQTMDLCFFSSTHQDGHLTAGLWSVGIPLGRTLVAHLSGGTTEILEAEETAPGTLDIQRLGGSADLNAGQFIDRIGVAMELSFPAGPQLERLAHGAQTGGVDLPLAVKGAVISFSGPESQARRLLQEGCPRADLARAVERCIADSLSLALASAVKRSSFQAVLVVGGVAANAFIRARLQEKLTGVLPGLKLFFAAAPYCSDSAVGVAVQAARRYRGQDTGFRINPEVRKWYNKR